MLEKVSLSQWIQSDGGPLVLMEKGSLNLWGGSLGTDNSSAITDYDKACLINDYLGQLEVGSYSALVLNDEPLRTAYWKINSEKVVFIRWRWANNEKDIIESLPEALGRDDWEQSEIQISFSTEDLILFDASYSAEEIEIFLDLNLSRGTYYTQTLLFEPNGETSVILHLLAKIK